MDWPNRIRAALAGASPVPDEDVIEELAQHARTMYETARADGGSHQEAERQVADQIDRWRIEAAALRHRPRRAPVIEPPPTASSRITGVAQDVRYAARLLRRQPRHAVLTILTMALGIGATALLFSVTYGVLIKPLAWPNADRVIVLKETRGGSPPRFGAFTNAAYLAWREEAKTIEHIAAWSQRLVTLSGTGEPERIRITAATASLFPALGLRPLIGSLFEQKDEAAPVIVLSEGLWRQRFGASPGVLGTLIHVDGQPYTVVGVLPDRLSYPDRQSRAIVPYLVRPTTNGLSVFSAVAALRPGATSDQAAAEGTARGRFAADTGLTTMAIFGSNGPMAIAAQPLHEAITADVRRPLLVLMVAVFLLLATATANAANLQLVRAIARSREMAIRAALGAGRSRMTRQLLVEGLLLGLTGASVGLVLTWLADRSLPALLPADFPRSSEIGVDAIVVITALVIAIGTSVISGLFPALRAGRLDLVDALAEDHTRSGAGLGSRTARGRAVVMSVQVAIACVLIVGASLLARSFVALADADRGYEPAGVLSARLSMPATLFPETARRFALIERVLDRLSVIPGLSDASFTSELPLTPGGSTSAFTMPSRDGAAGIVQVQASPRIVSPRYFSALGMRMIAGRGFTDQDTETSARVVVVNQAFARRYLGDAALGATLPVAYASQQGETRGALVIGVVDDVRYVNAAETSQPELFYSHRQLQARLPVETVTLVARTIDDSRAAGAALRAAIREADPLLVAEAVMPLDQRLTATLARPRLYAVLLGGFAGFALLIAAVGLFGLLSYSVSQRSRELAIRTALGARPAALIRLVAGQGLAVTLAGLTVGLLASAWLTRLLSSQLYGVSPYDPLTFVLVPLLLLLVAVLACIIPAIRAARLDPLRVFRGD
jgi:putative ABC transport system permease protein